MKQVYKGRRALPQMSDEQFAANLQLLSKRAQFIRGERQVRENGQLITQALSASVKKDLDEMVAALGDSKSHDELIALTKAAGRGDNDAKVQLCAIRVQTFNNYLLASQNKLSFFFNLIDLAEGETPYEQNETMQELRVSYVGADGQPTQTRIIKPQDESRIPLHFLTSEEYEYLLVDPYRGRISNAAKATVMLAYDMKNAIEAKAFAMITANAYGAFTTTGKNNLRTYLGNSYINTANLPSTNDITLEGTDANSKFRYDVFREIKKYGEQWADAFPDGPLVPTGRVLVPSSEVSDIARSITPTGSTSNEVANQLLEQGWTVVDIHGMKYTLIADNTLTPGVCYAEYNRKPGNFYMKSSLDEEIVDDSIAMKKKNKESRFMRKLIGGNINSFTRLFTARFRYTAAA